jgi:lipoyl(octanoyl) transferase
MIAVLHLGRCDYGTALRLQQRLVEMRQQGRIPNVLLLVEHPPVITLGRNARQANIIVSAEWLMAHDVEVHEINRGGDVTFHGPGQLVAYPIFDLRSFTPRLGAVGYVRLLEEVLMRICAHYGVETQRIAGLTGVWTRAAAPPRMSGRTMQRDYTPPNEEEPGMADRHERAGGTSEEEGAAWPERKIAAIGVHIARGVTSHGFALNVTTDLDFFRLIVPCGLTRPVTSIEFETGLQPSLDEVTTCASRCFGDCFATQMLWLESIHDLLPGSAQAESGESTASGGPGVAPEPCDTPARAPENERRIASDDFHLA